MVFRLVENRADYRDGDSFGLKGGQFSQRVNTMLYVDVCMFKLLFLFDRIPALISFSCLHVLPREQLIYEDHNKSLSLL